MPPLPPSSFGRGRRSASSWSSVPFLRLGRSVFGRLGRRRRPRSSRRFGRSVVGRVGRFRAGWRSCCSPSSLAGDHDDRDHQADDHRDQAGDQQPHVAVRALAVGVAVVGPIIRVGSSCIELRLRSEDRVEDRVGVLDLEAVSQPRRDLLPAAAGDGHLGRQQAGPGGAPRAAGVKRGDGGWRLLDRRDRARVGGARRLAARAGASRGPRRVRRSSSSSEASSVGRRRCLGLGDQRVGQLGQLGEPLGDDPVGLGLGLGELPRACFSASSITCSAARSAASTIAASRSACVVAGSRGSAARCFLTLIALLQKP